MNKFKLSTGLFCLLCCILLTSCAKEEAPTIDFEYVPVEQTAEAYIASYQVPAVMFSYNVLDTKTNILSTWLIDIDGNIRSSENESDVIYENNNLSQYYMNEKKSSTSATGKSVDLEDLVDNFKELRSAEKLSFDTNAASRESATITTVYGYFFAASMQEEACGCESDGETVQLYDSILLEQKSDNTVIQSNANASATLAWLNALNVQGE